MATKNVPIPFTIPLSATGTAQWTTKQLLPPTATGKVTGVVLDVDTSGNLSAATVYCVHGSGTVSAVPPTRTLSYASVALAPAFDAPTAFLEEFPNNPAAFRGLRLALLATWTGACTINGTVFVEVEDEE